MLRLDVPMPHHEDRSRLRNQIDKVGSMRGKLTE
jgi:hypothetical protein